MKRSISMLQPCKDALEGRIAEAYESASRKSADFANLDTCIASSISSLATAATRQSAKSLITEALVRHPTNVAVVATRARICMGVLRHSLCLSS